MSYIELYKNHRPRLFEDVIGQENTVNSLKQAIINDTIPTAYLFSGPPGTGKTTLAKIIAKAINCENREDGAEPCNECATCQAIDNDSQIGVTYISMANNGSVDDVRRIMNDAKVSQPVKRQVWILDEVQNLSSAAQDSLLIGLESEQMKPLFILCTTDPQKIKPAVLSRVQQRTLSPVSSETLVKHLINIVKKEKVEKGKITKEDVIRCVTESGGSVRNAIQNLERVLSGDALPTNFSNEILSHILDGNAIQTFQTIEKMAADGQDFVRTAERMYADLVLMLQIKSGVEVDNSKLKELSEKTTGKFVIMALNQLGDMLTSITNRVVDTKILFSIYTSKLALLSKNEKKENK